jgi:hypothetical protein
VAATLGMQPGTNVRQHTAAHNTLYRDHRAIRELLRVQPYTDGRTGKLAMNIAQEAATIVETRADVINIVLEELVRQGHELPAFSTLDEIAESARAQEQLYDRIALRLSAAQRRWLDGLLATELPAHRTLYNRINRSATKLITATNDNAAMGGPVLPPPAPRRRSQALPS